VLWEVIFMLVILKIPVAYLCAVVWWAIRAEPLPPEGAGVVASLGPPSEPAPCEWRRTLRRRQARSLRPRHPRGGRGRVAVARARAKT
jgi:hypothetical protein